MPDFCDHAAYPAPGSGTTCRCVVCPRCEEHTGNANQGHFWAYCKETRSVRTFHFCCPHNCELNGQAS